MAGKFKIFGLFTLLVFAMVMATAQNSAMPGELIQTHLSEKCIFPGENLWLSIYVSNHKDLPGKQISNLAFVEFVDNRNSSVIRKKVLLNNGIGTCSLSIPDTLSTGICYVMVYTSWLKNFGESSFSKSKVFVFNPDSPLKESSKEDIETAVSDNNKVTERIIINKEAFQTREKVTVKLNLDNYDLKSANYSVSVRKKEPEQILSETLSFSGSFKNSLEEIKYYPDYKGVLFNGQLIDKNNDVSVAEKEIIMSFPGENVDIKYARTNENGNFSFLHEPVVGDLDLVLNLPSQDYLVRLDEPFVNGFDEILHEDVSGLNKSTINYLKDRFVRVQLQNRFSLKNSVKETVKKDSAQYDFFGQPYQTIKLDDYKSLDSISEYFYELIQTVHFSNKKGEQQLYLTNPETNFKLGDNPVIFIDGVYYPGLQELASLDHNLVSEISVIPKVYYYRDKIYDGIVSIKTKANNFNQVRQLENMVRMIYKVSDTNEIFVPADKTILKKKNIPDLRSLLHWESNVVYENDESKEISFYTSDVKGEFIISVSGISNNGEFFNFEKTFSVSE